MTSSDHMSHTSPPLNMGINRYLVSVCIEYLLQPVALKEEGLFRVPGDSSLMRTLHKDFLSGSVDKGKLRSEVVSIAIYNIRVLYQLCS